MSENCKPLQFKLACSDVGNKIYVASDEAGYTYRIAESNRRNIKHDWVFACFESESGNAVFISKASYPSPNACIDVLNSFVCHPETNQDVVDYLDPYEIEREQVIRRDPSIVNCMNNEKWPRDIVVMQRAEEVDPDDAAQGDDGFTRGFNAYSVRIDSWDDIPEGQEPLDHATRVEYYEYLDHLECLRERYDEKNGQ